MELGLLWNCMFGRPSNAISSNFALTAISILLPIISGIICVPDTDDFRHVDIVMLTCRHRICRCGYAMIMLLLLWAGKYSANVKRRCITGGSWFLYSTKSCLTDARFWGLYRYSTRINHVHCIRTLSASSSSCQYATTSLTIEYLNSTSLS